MDSKTQSKPTYRIEETRELLPKLVDQVVQSNSLNEKNIKEEIEELISNDPSFVRSISNAINNVPSAGGTLPIANQEPEGVVKPIEMPFEEVREIGGDFTAPSDSDSDKINVGGNVSEAPSFSNDSSSVSTLGESIKSEIYSLAQSLMSELRSLGNRSSGDDTALNGSPEDIRQLANEMGKGKGPDGGNIRFERMDDGNYQQYIDGNKGEVFTENELRNAVGGSGFAGSGSDITENQSFLDKINEAGKGQAPDGGNIRFERMADGNYQQYVDGAKGEVFTKEELQEVYQDQEKEKESGETGDVSSTPDEDRAEDSSKTSKTSDDSFPVPLDVTGEICIVGFDKFEIWDKIKENQSNSKGLTLQASVSDQSGFPSAGSIEFIDEYDPSQTMEQLMEFDGAGVNKRQTKWKLPLAKKDSSSGGWEPLSQGGYYNLSLFCVNGVPSQYPLRNF